MDKLEIDQPERSSRLSSYREFYKAGYRPLSTQQEDDWQRRFQPKFLKQHGLRPDSKFLDLGCGYLRGTIDLVDYLNDGNFFGIDISQRNIEDGRESARQLCHHTPNLAVADSFEIEETWPNVQFDFILAASLLTHLYPADLTECLRRVYRVLEGKFFATIFKDNTVPIYDGVCTENGAVCIDHRDDHPVGPGSRQANYARLNFCYNTSWIAQIAKSCQLGVREIGETEIGQFMLEVFPYRR